MAVGGKAMGSLLHNLIDLQTVAQSLLDSLDWYYALNGVNILLLILRVLKLMDFQPRLGVVTRSLALAAPDLLHFCLVCGVIFTGFALMAHLIFGNAVEVKMLPASTPSKPSWKKKLPLPPPPL
jgi:Polycystin cation channel